MMNLLQIKRNELPMGRDKLPILDGNKASRLRRASTVTRTVPVVTRTRTLAVMGCDPLFQLDDLEAALRVLDFFARLSRRPRFLFLAKHGKPPLRIGTKNLSAWA
jgi:hypothetical protein